MPTLLPEGLGPDGHLKVALNVQHPVARPVRLKEHIHHALDNQHVDPSHLNAFRSMVMDLVLALGSLLQTANDLILSCVHVDLYRVLSRKNLALMREINFVVRCPDFSSILDLVWGLPMAGWARHSPNLVQRLSAMPKPLETSLDDAFAHNLSVLAKVRSTGDVSADELAWSKCQREFDTGGLLGPWHSLDEHSIC